MFSGWCPPVLGQVRQQFDFTSSQRLKTSMHRRGKSTYAAPHTCFGNRLQLREDPALSTAAGGKSGPTPLPPLATVNAGTWCPGLDHDTLTTSREVKRRSANFGPPTGFFFVDLDEILNISNSSVRRPTRTHERHQKLETRAQQQRLLRESKLGPKKLFCNVWGRGRV